MASYSDSSSLKRSGLWPGVDFWVWGELVVIYIPVLNEGLPCWRPVEAEQLQGSDYRIVSTKPDDENWPVTTGDVVRCEPRRFSDGLDCLVAIIPESHLPPPVS